MQCALSVLGKFETTTKYMFITKMEMKDRRTKNVPRERKEERKLYMTNKLESGENNI